MISQEALNDFIRSQRSEDNVSKLPLKDIRVIDMASVMAAPFAATLMGDFGADVIKVEPPNVPDAIRAWGVLDGGIQPFWTVFGRHKFPVTINLKSRAGKEVFLRLIEKSDVLIENMRPGTMERLGLDMDSLLTLNPGLVIGRVSGYGQTGPYAHKPGFGTLAEGFSGFTFLNAQPNGVPTNPPIALADLTTGIHLAFAIMMALRSQKRLERGGCIIDISLYEPLFGMLGANFLSYFISGEIPHSKGNELSYVAPRNNYATKDKKWVALSGATQKQFERLMELVGHPEMKDDPRYKTNEERIKDENRQVINQVIAKWIGNRNLFEILNICDEFGITVGPITTMEDISKDVHYQERESVVEIKDPISDAFFKMPSLPFRVSSAPFKIRFTGLPQGSANEVIFSDLLEYSPEQITKICKFNELSNSSKKVDDSIINRFAE